jgi:hypothetical protein
VSKRKPISLLDLQWACSSLGLLLSCSHEWIPEDEWEVVADGLRQHLTAAAKVLTECAEKNSESLKLSRYDSTDEVVRRELADLRYHLSGRTSIGPGNPLHLSHDDE